MDICIYTTWWDQLSGAVMPFFAIYIICSNILEADFLTSVSLIIIFFFSPRKHSDVPID